MNVAVCIPYRAGVPERDRNFAYVQEWWSQLKDWAVVTGDDDADEAFSAGRSRNIAAASVEWDVAVFTDADMVPGGIGQVRRAVEKAAVSGMYVTLHSEIRYVGEQMTDRVCAGKQALSERAVPVAMGGVWIPSCAIRRDLWDEIGGYDPRLHGYGGEDLALYFAASTLAGAIRNEGPLYHLWHPDVPAENRLDGTWTVVNAYSGAVGDRDAMRAVVAAGRA